jgi:hypothetical protein
VIAGCVSAGFPRSPTKGIPMTKTTVAAALAAILLSGPALSDSPDQIRAMLLATPEWRYEWGQPLGHPDPHGGPGKVETGKVSFVEKDGRLIGKIDEGFKCDNEVTLFVDGFYMDNCLGNNLQYVSSGNEFKARHGYNYTIRPAP